MSAAPLSLRTVGSLCFILTLGCGGLKPAETSSGLSPLSQSCAEPHTSLDDLTRVKLCVEAFNEAAARQDARSAGQALLIWARYQDADKREPWLKLSLWLNPQPWLPKSAGWQAKELERHQVERMSVQSIQALRFEGSKPQQALKTYLVPIKLPAPSPDLDGIEIKLAAAVGVPAVIIGDELFAATPTLAELTRASSTLDLTQIKRATLLAKADLELAQGEHLAATATLLSAIEESDESPKPCGALAMARYSLYILGPSILISGQEGYLDEITTRCASKRTDADQPPAIEDPYWVAITTLERMQKSALLERLKQPAGLETYLETLPSTISRAQREWVTVLAKKLLLTDALFNQDERSLCEQTSKPSAAQIKELIQTLQQAKRHDLAYHLYMNAFIFGKDSEAIDLKGALAWLTTLKQQPMPTWQRIAGEQSLFKALPMTLTPLDQVLIQPSCLSYASYITEQAAKDDGLGAPRRAAGRLLELMRHQHLCGNSALRPLAEQTIDQLMRSKDGRLNIAKLLGQLSVESIQLLVQGKMDSIFQIMSVLSPKLEALERSLTDSTADLTLRSLLGIARQVSLQVQPPELLKQLEQSLAGLDLALKAPPQPTDDALLQYAPALRLLFGHMLLTTRIVFGAGDPKAEIARIEKTLEQDLRAVMRLLEQDLSLGSLISAHLKVLYSTIMMLQSPSIAQLNVELQKVETLPSHKLTGWWAVGITTAQLSLLSAQAWGAHAINNDELRQRALQEASTRMDKMVQQGLEHFKVQGSNWELLKLMVPAYDLVAQYIISPEGDVATMKLIMQRLPEFERAAKLIMSDIEAHTGAMAGAPNFVDLFVELLKATLKVGMLNIYDPVNETLTTRARTQIADDLELTSARYSPQLQVYLYALIAALRAEKLAPSMKALNKASALGKGAPEAYLPALLALRIHGEGWTKPKETLALMEQVFEMTKSSDRCQAQQPLIALYPQYARLIDIAQPSARSAQLRETYLKSVIAQEAGEVTLSCQINASKGYVKATLNLTFPTSTISFIDSQDTETKAENESSTFQVGLGFSSELEDSEDLKCSLERDAKTQLAQIYQLHLDQALVELWRPTDPHRADMSLQALLELNQRLLYTQAHAMQRDGAQLNYAAQWIDLAQLRWVIVLAQLRGYWQTARVLHEGHTQLLARTSRSAAQLKETPKFVMAISGLSALKPLVDALSTEDSSPPKLEALSTIWAQIKAKQTSMSEANLLLLEHAIASYHYADHTRWPKIKAMKNEQLSGLQKSMAFWLESATRTPQNIDASIEAVLATDDHHAELWPLLKTFTPLLSTSLLVKHLDNPIATRFFADELIKRLDQIKQPEVVLAQWLKHSADFTDWESVANARYGQVKMLAADAKWAQSAQALGQLNGKLAESLPLNHPTLLDLLTLQIALSGLANEDISATLKAMNTWVNTLSDAPEELKATLQSWTAQRQAPATLKTSMMAHVKKSLGI